MAGCLWASLLAAADPPSLSVAEFQELHKQLQPPKDEVWRTIPWKTSILEARDLASKEKKPVFMWAMVGHPLACT
jgi:hypothetical protein